MSKARRALFILGTRMTSLMVPRALSTKMMRHTARMVSLETMKRNLIEVSQARLGQIRLLKLVVPILPMSKV